MCVSVSDQSLAARSHQQWTLRVHSSSSMASKHAEGFRRMSLIWKMSPKRKRMKEKREGQDGGIGGRAEENKRRIKGKKRDKKKSKWRTFLSEEVETRSDVITTDNGV